MEMSSLEADYLRAFSSTLLSQFAHIFLGFSYFNCNLAIPILVFHKLGRYHIQHITLMVLNGTVVSFHVCIYFFIVNIG